MGAIMNMSKTVIDKVKSVLEVVSSRKALTETASFYAMLVYRIVVTAICGFVEKRIKDVPSNLPPITSRHLLKPATELAEDIRSGRVAAMEVVSAYIAQIMSVNPILNAIIQTRHEEAFEQAREIDFELVQERNNLKPRNLMNKPLIGVPMTIKNSNSVAGMVHDGGVPALAGQLATRDSSLIKRLRESGVIILGITNTPQALAYMETTNRIYGLTNNPYDLSRTVYASSGGEGAAIASACSLIGLGSDMLGSCRLPALCCGIFGHKPTNSTINSMDGLVPPYSKEFKTFFTCGPMARFASDLKPMLGVMVEPDQLGKLKLDEKVDLSSLKIYVFEKTNYPLITTPTKNVSKAVARGVEHLRTKFNCDVRKFDESFINLTLTDVCAALKDSHPESLGNVFIGRDPKDKVSIVHELFKALTGRSRNSLYALAALVMEPLFDLFTEKYQGEQLKAKNELMKSRLHQLLGDDSVLIMPTLPYTAPKHGTTLLRVADMAYCLAANIYEIPATHVTIGLTDRGLPIGFQVAAGPFMDRLSLAVAEELEVAFGGWVPPCLVDVRDANENLE